ncbi:Major facilitator superfamily domaingeneral substrate transporter [Penicillium sp. IBT 31633x]|nr:Major facilitator superfamily domaingeneral substrate transporter [Penicillium sp. IBT 31633x]
MESTEKQISLDAGFHVPYSSDKGPEPTHTPGNVTAVDANGNSDQVPVNREAQAGVKGFQATATVWTEAHLILEYVIREAHNELALLKFYPTNSEAVIRSLNPYVTSAFMLRSLTAATSIMANIIGGLSKIP